MQTPLKIAFHNVESSAEVKNLIEEKAAWLEQYYGRITGCRVTVEGPSRPRHGQQYGIRLVLAVPGAELVVHHVPQRQAPVRDLAAVIRDGFDVARRRLEEHARMKRNEVKWHQPAPRDNATFNGNPEE